MRPFDFFHLSIVTFIYFNTDVFVVANRQCILPEFPENGEYSLPQFQDYEAGSHVASYTPLLIHCDKGYHKSNLESDISNCINGRWHPPVSTCVRSCKPLRSTATSNVTCYLNDRTLENCENPIEGTSVKLTCESFYESPNAFNVELSQCKDGSWYPTFSYCKPVCGDKRPTGIPVIINGTDVKLGNWPWQVAIYQDNVQRCGGAILTENFVVSAAHCFARNKHVYSYPIESYVVAAGKYHQLYDHPEDSFAQYSRVSHVYLPERYRGTSNMLEADVVILLLETPFKFSLAVQPVCVDFQNAFEADQLQPGKSGVVTGWGFTDIAGNSSETLKELNIPYVSYDNCHEAVPFSFRKYLTHDKICGGYLNEGKSICIGDSGGALSFYNEQNKKYYIRAIVSMIPTKNLKDCDSDQYSAFTLLSKHLDFIRHKILSSDLPDNRRIEDDIQQKCILPLHPSNGEYELSFKDYRPGEHVLSYTKLFLRCKNSEDAGKYSRETSMCLDGHWVPLPPTCNTPQFTPQSTPTQELFITLRCNLPEHPSNGIYFMNDVRDYRPGVYVSEHSQLMSRCDEDFKPKSPNNVNALCYNGTWIPQLPQCTASFFPTFCSSHNPAYVSCMQTALEYMGPYLLKGIKSINFPKFNPLEMKSFYLSKPFNDLITITSHLTNIQMYGFERTRIDNLQFDPHALTGQFRLTIPQLHAETDYDTTGSYSILSYNSVGRFTGDANNVRLQFSFTLKKVLRSGVEYFKLKSFSAKCDLDGGNVKMTDNLAGHQFAADFVANYVNGNQRLTIDVLRPIYEDSIEQFYRNCTEIILASLPANEFLPN